MVEESQLHGLIVPPFRRIARANVPALRQPIPALIDPVENANVILNKQIAPLNRAGSNPGNPILSGLGGQFQYFIAPDDQVQGIFIYQEREDLGQNLLASAAIGAPNLVTLNHKYGAGLSVSGSPLTGAVKNFIRWASRRGTIERQFYVKSFDADVVSLGQGVPALDPATLLPVPFLIQIVDATRAFLDIPIDFFQSWNDEFGVLHNTKNEFIDVGFKKSYGGSAFVSFFDTSTATEGVGVQVSPVTEALISDQHFIQVENTVGLKQITVRFRSKQGSICFVDVPIEVQVIAAPSPLCNPPVTEVCGEMLLLVGQLLLTNLQDKASVVGIQDVAGTPGNPVDRDLLWVSINMAIVGATVELRVRKFQAISDPADIAGVKFRQVGGDLDFLPLVTAALSPTPGPPYATPVRATVCFDVAALKSEQVALIAVMGKDQQLVSELQIAAGPSFRDASFFPLGGLGGGDACVYE